MKLKQSFPERVLLQLQKKLSLRLRAGTGAHRFIGIWFVVVEGRVFVRSWSIKPDGWYREFLREARGAIQIDKVEMAVRAVPVRNMTLRDGVDRAFLKRYSTPGARKYAKDLCLPKSRETTTELIPLEDKDAA
jgi:hypothetical protein